MVLDVRVAECEDATGLEERRMGSELWAIAAATLFTSKVAAWITVGGLVADIAGFLIITSEVLP